VYKRPLCIRNPCNFKPKLGKVVTALQYFPVLPCKRDPQFLKQIKRGKKGSLIHRKIRQSQT